MYTCTLSSALCSTHPFFHSDILLPSEWVQYWTPTTCLHTSRQLTSVSSWLRLGHSLCELAFIFFTNLMAREHATTVKVSILHGRAPMLHSSSDDMDAVWESRCHTKRAHRDRAWLAFRCACGGDSVLKPPLPFVYSLFRIL